jgi:hypothetical protein
MVRKWLFPLACIGLIIISFLPPYTQGHYDPRNTQDVIFSVLMSSIQPYEHWGWVFHVATLLLLFYVIWKPQQAGRVMASYMGINYLIIAAVQPHSVTEKYGFALLTGATVGTAIIGITWLVVVIKDSLKLSLKDIPGWTYSLLPLALLVFWSPMKTQGEAVIPNFDLRLLLTSADYGLTYCFVTPVFLYLLLLFSRNYTSLAFRISAFNALLYGMLNLTHWFNPNTRWLGVMHLPLLILSLVALFMPLMKRSLHPKVALSPG